MSTGTRIATFAVVLGAAFVAAFALGSAFEPADTEAGDGHGAMEAASGGHGAMTAAGHGRQAEAGGHGGHEDAAAAMRGLAVSEDGYTLRLSQTRVSARETRRLRFRIEGPDGAAVTRFDELHEREMHLIVVRRDGAHFQHLHPTIDGDGTWSVALKLPAPGVYRAFADFSVAGETHTLAADVFAPGAFRPRSLPAAATVDRTAGYEVRLREPAVQAGVPSTLRFFLRKGGEPVAPAGYLGARGHLVALREGDLAYLHVHPDAGETAPHEIPYSATFPTVGRYRLYLQFKHAGRVQTAEFTLAVAR